jgi:hypothetical protein
MSQSVSETERRRYDRVALKLPGRYMLADGQEFDCQIIDVSPAGVAIQGPLPGDLGEHVVAYIQELGRIEGVIVRRAVDWFAVALQVPSSRLQKLTTRIDGLARRRAEGASERRSYAREDLDPEPVTLQLTDGRAFSATLIDVSTGGAALEVYVAPPVGAAVTIGERRGHVSRHFAGGIAVTFDSDTAGKTCEAQRRLERLGRRVDRPLCEIRSNLTARLPSILAIASAAVERLPPPLHRPYRSAASRRTEERLETAPPFAN